MAPVTTITPLHGYDLLGCHADGDTYCRDHCPSANPIAGNPNRVPLTASERCELAGHSAIFGDHEADTPEHCCVCGALLDIRLTSDGVAYVADAIEAYEDYGDGDADVIAAWRECYRDALNAPNLP